MGIFLVAFSMAWPAGPCDGKVVLTSMPIYPPHFREVGSLSCRADGPSAKVM
jgi:hypothetical protein